MNRRLVKFVMFCTLVSMIFGGFVTTLPKILALEPTFNLKVTPFCGYNMLEWETVKGAENYWIYRGPGEGEEYSTPLTDFPISDNNFKDEINIENNKKYCYYVRAVDTQAEEFAQSIEACATPTCPEEEEVVECRLVLKYQVGNKMYWVADKQKGPMEAPPEINLNRMFLLIRYAAEEVGAVVAYDAATKTVTITTADGNVLQYQIGNPIASLNGVKKPIDPNNPKVVPYIKNGRSFGPMRWVAENLGATGPDDIKWFEKEKTVELWFDETRCKKTFCFTVERVDCNAKQPLVYGKDADGKLIILYVDKDLCAKMKPGTCWLVTVYPRKPQTTTVPMSTTSVAIRVWKVGAAKQVDCPCTNEMNEYNLCGTVKEARCDKGVIIINAIIDPTPPDLIAIDDDVTWRPIYLTLPDANMCTKFPVGSSVEASGPLTLTPDNMIAMKATRITATTKPCAEKLTCFCATILRVDCAGDKVLVKDEKGIQWFLSGISKDMCAKLKPEMCIKVCGTPINQQVANLPQLSVKTIEIVSCPCGGTEEECFCVEIIRSDMNSDPPVIIGKDKNGKQFNLSFSANMTRSQYIRFKVGTCWTICGVYAEVISPVTSPFKFKVTKYEEVPCPCAEPVEICFCLTIEKVDCTSDPPRIWGKDENGKAWVLILTRELCAKYANYLTVGKCIKVCGIVQSSSPTFAAMPPTIKVTKIEPTDCPCKSVSPDCDWHRGTVISIGPVTGAQGFQVVIEDCNTKQRFIAIAKENLKDKDLGIPLNSYKEKCIEICVKDGVIVAWRALLGVTDCCSIQEEKCWCITITRVDCSSDPPKIWGIDENGQDWVMLLNKELCARYANYLVANRCIKVCGIVTKIPISPNVDGIGIRVTSITPMDCPCKSSETCFCFTIEKVDCTSDPPRAWGKDENGKAWVLQLNKAFCDKYKDILIPGKCIKVCGQVKTPVATTNVPTPLLVVTSIAPTDCPCKIQEETCICFQIKEASCTGDNLFIYGFDENGTAWKLPLNKEICDKWGKYLIAGKCIKVCFISIPGAVPKITNIYPADCPCKPVTEDCKWVKGRIDSVTRITDTKLGVKFIPCDDPTIVMQFIAENMVDASGKYKLLDYKGCAEICVGPNNTIVKWKALPDVKDCCPAEVQNCFCFTLEKFEEYGEGVYIIGKSENGAPTRLFLNKEIWAKYKRILVIGKCYKICLDPTGAGNYTISPTDCPCKPVTEDCKWVKGKIVVVQSTVLSDRKIYLVVFKPCDGQAQINFFADTDLSEESGKVILTKYIGCAELCILGDKIIKWKALPDVKDCCPTEEKNCFCFTLEKFEEIDVGVYIIGKSENGAPTKLLLYKEIWTKYKSILVIGKCYIICLDPEGKGNYTITPANCPCIPSEECNWIRGKILGVSWLSDLKLSIKFSNCDVPINAQTYISNDIVDTTKHFPLSQYRGCAEICVGPNNTIIKWKALPDVKDCCKTEEKETCICLTIDKVNCKDTKEPTITGKDENGNAWTILMTSEFCDRYGNYLVVGRCIKVCGIFKPTASSSMRTLKVTSISPTECPCNPDEVNCDWIKGQIMAVYTGAGVPKDKGNYMMFFWQCVDYSGAGGRWFYAKTDLLDTTGKYVLSQYRGCAELCMKDNIIIKWKAITDAKECCPPPTRVGRCVNVEGLDCNANPPRFWGKTTWPGELCVVYVTKEQCAELKVGQCFWVFGKIMTVPTGFTIAIQAETMTPASPCPCPQPIVTTTCIKVDRNECNQGLSYVWGYDSDGILWWLLVSQTLCNTMKPGTCWKITGWAGSTGATREMENVTAEPADCSCAEPKPNPNCKCITIKEKDCKNFQIFGVDENGHSYMIRFPGTNDLISICEKLEIGACYEMCYEDITDAAIYVKTFKKVDCPCKSTEECKWQRGKILGATWLTDLKLTIKFSYCDDPTKVQTYISDDLIDITNRFPLSQYRGCAELCVDEKGNIIKWKALPDVKDCCKTEDEETVICLTIDKVNCSDTSKPTVMGKDENGIPWTLIMTRELCAKYANYLVAGSCIRVRGGTVQYLRELKVTSINPTECPCKPEEETCDWIRAQVMITYGESWVRETHDAAFLTWVIQCIDYEGAGGRFFLLKSDLLDTTGKYKFSEYKGCAELCVQGEYLIKWKAITDVNECCPPPTRVGRCVNVEEINCNADPPWFSGTTTWYPEKCIVYVTKEQCANLEIGQCYWVHGLIKTPPAGYQKAIQAESLQTSSPCPCPRPVVVDMCVKVERTDCVPPYYYVWAKDADGTLYMIFTNQGICAQMQPGTCWKIKGTKSPYMGLMAVGIVSYEKTDCSCAEPKPLKEECFCVENLKFDCRVKPPKIYGTLKNGDKVTLIIDEKICSKYSELDSRVCIEVCAVRSKLISRVPTWKVTKITRIDCPCKESKPTCFCVNILRQNCDKNIILAQLGSNLIQLTVPADVCKLMEPGTCWYVCGYYEPIPGSTPGFIVEKFEKRDCPCKDENSDCCNNFRFKMDWPDLNVPLCQGDSTKIAISFTNTCKTDLTLMPVVDNTVAGSTMYASPTTLLIGPGETKSVMVYITLPSTGTSFRGHWKLLIYCGNNNVKTFEFPIKIRDCSNENDCPKMFKRTKLAEIRCKESYVIVGTGELVERLFFTDSQAKEWCNLDIGACYNFCFKEDKNGKKWGITAEKVECPGENPVEIGDQPKHTLVIQIVDLDTIVSVAEAITPDDSYINVDYEDDSSGKFVRGEWYLVTGGVSFKPGKRKLTIHAEVIEPLKKICVVIDKINCKDDKFQLICHEGNDKGGKSWACKIDPELCDSLKPGMCWLLWGIETGSEGFYWHMNVLVAKPTRCPCGSSNLEWADVIIESLDCSSRLPVAKSNDPKGELIILKFTTPDDCKFLKPGDAIRVYGRSGISNGIKFVDIELIKRLKMVCGEVKSIYNAGNFGYATILVDNCLGIPVYLYRIDYLGTGVQFPFWDKLKVGDCYQFYFVDPGYYTGCWGWSYYTSFVFKTDCPCVKKIEPRYNCVWKAGKILNVVQTDFGSWMVEFKPCDKSITYTIYTDPKLVDLTKKLTIKDFKGCAALCLNDGIVKQWKILPEGECCQEDIQCMCVTIEKIDCSGEIGKIYGKEASGKTWVLLLSQTLDFNCKDLEPEMCIEVCGARVAGTDNAFEIFEIKQVKCPCANPQLLTKNKTGVLSLDACFLFYKDASQFADLVYFTIVGSTSM